MTFSGYSFSQCVKATDMLVYNLVLDELRLQTDMMYRYDYSYHISHGLVTKREIGTLGTMLRNSKTIEVMAGRGYIAKSIQIDIEEKLGEGEYLPIDIKDETYETFTDVKVQDATTADLSPYDYVLMVWPPYKGNEALEVLKNMQVGQTLIYLGEYDDGRCANDAFFDYMATEFEMDDTLTKRLNNGLIRWYGNLDSWTVTKKVGPKED